MHVQSVKRFAATKVTFQDTIELFTREKGHTNVLFVLSAIQFAKKNMVRTDYRALPVSFLRIAQMYPQLSRTAVFIKFEILFCLQCRFIDVYRVVK